MAPKVWNGEAMLKLLFVSSIRALYLLIIDSLLETITERIGESDVSKLLEIEKSG